MKSHALKKLHKSVGDSIHAMNTIAVSLSRLPNENVKPPEELRISWAPKNTKFSKVISRSYAERAAIVYATESFFEYLKNISTDSLWQHPEINFHGVNGKNEKIYKHKRVYTFLTKVPHIEEHSSILAELLCHWRNKIVHLNANPTLEKGKICLLISKKQYIYDNLHHFDVERALENFKENAVTLKDSSTLITIALQAAEKIDNFFFDEIKKMNKEEIFEKIKEHPDFKRISHQNDSARKERQLKMLIISRFPYFKDIYQ